MCDLSHCFGIRVCGIRGKLVQSSTTVLYAFRQTRFLFLISSFWLHYLARQISYSILYYFIFQSFIRLQLSILKWQPIIIYSWYLWYINLIEFLLFVKLHSRNKLREFRISIKKKSGNSKFNKFSNYRFPQPICQK